MSLQLDEVSRRLRAVLEVDDHVILTKDREGIIRYKGGLDNKSGIFYGIELTKGSGKHNGTYKGRRYFSNCRKNKGIFVDKRQILHKKDKKKSPHKKRSSMNLKNVPDVFHCEFMYTIHGIWKAKNGIDPIGECLHNEWDVDAANATQWKQKWHLMKQLLNATTSDELYNELPARFIYNKQHRIILSFLIEWLQNEKHIGSRKLILKWLVPYCKTYKINKDTGHKLAQCLIQKQWKERKHGFRGLATKALLSVYYASDCLLEEWIPSLMPVFKSKSDVRIQAWNFLSEICILAAKTKRTLKKQTSLMDIECLLSDGNIIQLIKQTMNNEIGDSAKINNKIMLACAEFVFGAKYILPNMKGINSVYNELKQNGELMRDVGLDEYCQFLVKGDNAFDRGQPIADVIDRPCSKIFCDYCSIQDEKYKEIEEKVKNVKEGMESLKDIAYALKVTKNEEKNEIIRVKAEYAMIGRKMRLLEGEIKEMNVEIAQLNLLMDEWNENEERKGMDELDLQHWDKWNCADVLQWIFAVGNGIYLKYERDLNMCVRMENIKGSELHLLNDDDLNAFGIKDKKERNRLMQCIKALINKDIEKKAIEPGSLQHEGIAF